MKEGQMADIVTTETGKLNRTKYRFYSYTETSSQEQTNVTDAFKECVQVYFAMVNAKKELAVEKC